MSKNLVIVESPAKAKTIEGYLGKDFTVKSSFGHVRDLASKGLAIDVENNFAPEYEVSSDKKALVAELKKLAKESDVVWLATDEDREGEAISWHLYETLGLAKKDTKRITFNEITKGAILKAIENPRQINKPLVDAQQARRVLDRLVGFELSPVLWKKVRPSLSAGRVQSVAVRLIVEREKEIQQFKAESYFRVTGEFLKGKERIKAELSKTFDKEVDASEFLTRCATYPLSVQDVQKKPAKKTPASPFTTSTLQQEASLKLGFSVSRTMQVAQRLYEAGHITYMRTDSVNLSETAMTGAKNEILSAYGKEYSHPTKYTNKNSNAQEAHEAIRPTNFAMHALSYGEREEVRLYDLIWKRSIASQMSHAELERTTISIGNEKMKEVFQAKGEVIKFDGFLKVYLETNLDEDENDSETEGLLPAVQVGEELVKDNITATQRFSRPSARYVEASLVKKLEELGIGRPSTYAPTISTIQKRGYVEKQEREGEKREYIILEMRTPTFVEKQIKTEITGKEKNKLFPTDIGMVVTDFLVDHFGGIMDYHFTAEVEEQFDEIARGKMEWTDMLSSFYKPFHHNVEDTLEHSDRATGERDLGIDPTSNKKVIARIGRFGPMIQIGDEKEDGDKPRFASLLSTQSIHTISLKEALELFQLPKSLGEYKGVPVEVNVGRFGPYVKFGDQFISLAKGDDPMDFSMDQAIVLIDSKLQADAPIGIVDGLPVQKGVGRFGPFIKWNGIFINVSKKYDFDHLTQQDIETLVAEKIQKDIDKVVHDWKEEGIRVEKARWGKSVILKGKLKIELASTVDAAGLTLEKVKEMIEKKAPAKKTAAKKAPAKKAVAKKK
nr:type I DNA topoisomerase [uncultured Fluviicola sp.]